MSFKQLKEVSEKFTTELLLSLTPREEKVCKMIQKGFDVNDISVYFEVPQERIEQIAAKVLRKINHKSRLHLWNQTV